MVVINGNEIRFTGSPARFEDIPFAANEARIFNLTLRAGEPMPVPGTSHTYHASLRQEIDGQIVGGVNYVIVTRAQDTDTDGDGIPDSQETPPFTLGVDDRAVDSDHDGFANAAEWAAGTNPASSPSFLQFSQLSANPGAPGETAVTLLFPTVVGRNYYVDFTDSILGGIWTALPGSIRIGDGAAKSVTDTTDSPARCYRLQAWR